MLAPSSVPIVNAPLSENFGQNPRFLQLNATNHSLWQDSQSTRRKPCSSRPHFRYASNSLSTYAGYGSI